MDGGAEAGAGEERAVVGGDHAEADADADASRARPADGAGSIISGPAFILIRGLKLAGEVHAQLLLTPGFYLICIMSFLLTTTRETLGNWLPMYLKTTQEFSLAEAAFGSAIFPAAGAISSLIVGHATDWTFRGERGGVMVVSLLGAGAALAAMAMMPESWPSAWQLAAIGVVGLLVLGPYALLSGTVSMDLGGRSGVATTANVIDAVGYAGGVVAGTGVALVVINTAWRTAINGLAVMVLFAAIIAALYWWGHERRGIADNT